MYNCPAIQIYQYSHVEKCRHFFSAKTNPYIYILLHRSIIYAVNIYIYIYVYIIICYMYICIIIGRQTASFGQIKNLFHRLG